MMEQMTLSELKTGMHVVMRNGEEYVVLKDTCLNGNYQKDIIRMIPSECDCCFTSLSRYNENMTNKSGFEDLDIVAVYNCNNVIHIWESAIDNEAFTQIFAEEETIMTKAEAEQKFGIRIVD